MDISLPHLKHGASKRGASQAGAPFLPEDGCLTEKGASKEARKSGSQEVMVWLLGGNDALDFERWLGEAQDQPVLTASGAEVGANHREVDILESLDRFEMHWLPYAEQTLQV